MADLIFVVTISFAFLPAVRADGWSEFTNNLATDLVLLPQRCRSIKPMRWSSSDTRIERKIGATNADSFENLIAGIWLTGWFPNPMATNRLLHRANGCYWTIYPRWFGIFIVLISWFPRHNFQDLGLSKDTRYTTVVRKLGRGS